MYLSHLIYVSTASKQLAPNELLRILDTSVRHNAQHGVTGMLLYAGGGFMQVLEGDEPVVDAVYARIVADRRHKDIILIDRSPIDARSFPDWTMGFRHLGAPEAATHPNFAPFFAYGFDPARLGARPGLALELLRGFAADQRS